MFTKSVNFQNIHKIPWYQDGYEKFHNNFANFFRLQHPLGETLLIPLCAYNLKTF